MRFGWIVLLLLSFPVLEAIGIFWAASAIGGWVLLWLLLAAVAGILLIRVERVAWGARLLFSVQSGAYPLAKLKEIFKKAQASMFEMTKMINAHLK